MTDMTYQLPVQETLQTSWDKVYGSKATFWMAIFFMALITIGLGVITGILVYLMPGGDPIFNALMNFILYLVNLGLLYMGIKRAKDLPINPQQLFHAFSGNMILKVIGLYILQCLILLVPVLILVGSVFLYAIMSPNLGVAISTLVSVLLFLVGLLALIYLTIRIMLSIGFVLDKEMGPIDAIKQSFAATNGNFWSIFSIVIIQSLIIFISAIPLFIGLIWTLPFAFINFGVIYDKLTQSRSQV